MNMDAKGLAEARERATRAQCTLAPAEKFCMNCGTVRTDLPDALDALEEAVRLLEEWEEARETDDPPHPSSTAGKTAAFLTAYREGQS